MKQQAKKPGNDQKNYDQQQNKTDQPSASNPQQQINDQVTGKKHESNNDGAPIHPGSDHKIRAWVEAQPDAGEKQKSN
ncbi:MAG TPA: hypothetical protein VG605_18980 [Puia sp.]|jgi:hypothetical protein|nr:hypothetical protein [Puia sp.]